MKIKTVRITNFRGYKETVEINFQDLTVLVGKNDIGKSTVLEALDIFFNNGKGTVKFDKTDINVEAANEENYETIIDVEFCDLPTEIILDSSVKTTLKKEYLLTEDGTLRIIKKSKNAGSFKTFIMCNHPSNPTCSDLLAKKIGDLRTIIEDYGIKCEDKAVSSVIRASIWNHFSGELNKKSREIDVASKDGDAKQIWEKISRYLPVYSLFQADRKNSDGDDEVQDPLKEAVQLIMKESEIQEKLSWVAKRVEEKLMEVSGRTLEKLREIDSSVADSLAPVIPPVDSLKWHDVFKNVSISGDQNIPINKRGSGVKRLVLLSFFRAAAEKRFEEESTNGVIYAIEEPETAQHSENQKKLIDSLIELSQSDNTQILMTTHSAFMVKQLNYDNLRVIQESADGKKTVIKVEPSVLMYPSLNEVNYIAFHEITEEYLNELYGTIESNNWLAEFKTGKTTIPYIRLFRDGTTKNENHILATYIRHMYHHPENSLNVKYTTEQLAQAIQEMRDFISKKNAEPEE